MALPSSTGVGRMLQSLGRVRFIVPSKMHHRLWITECRNDCIHTSQALYLCFLILVRCDNRMCLCQRVFQATINRPQLPVLDSKVLPLLL